ncbi:MAG: CopG family transcriptional regulator [Brevundimonas sp.]|uniref:CopG family transcriptional regulator n=1 Tax=Brevundimonas sp. TaxID=1871086 RepID=UPI002724428F|nr:CopG family transcriptional regulator [Brevundimonas sp.]MDO9078357.1 CopG family transcriptional regulator [Brevundimonas sp.]MDP3081036.1 CopG family transcriptional regulator [Brevundimonas sp.]MDZ4062396.1 CopG family transcriptional regulator [Brevundimonas sp.]
MSDPRNELDEEPAAFVFEEAVELDARELKAMADIDAGRFITHEAVVRWLKSWGTADELPPPKCGD